MLLLIVWEHITMKTSFNEILSYVTNSNWIYQEHKPGKTFSFYLSFEWKKSNFIIHHAMIESLWLGYCMHTHQFTTILFGLQTMLIHFWETPLKSAVCSVKCTSRHSVWSLSCWCSTHKSQHGSSMSANGLDFKTSGIITWILLTQILSKIKWIGRLM